MTIAVGNLIVVIITGVGTIPDQVRGGVGERWCVMMGEGTGWVVGEEPGWGKWRGVTVSRFPEVELSLSLNVNQRRILTRHVDR